eukprot:5784212-Pyramimonas_sp.AAC.1
MHVFDMSRGPSNNPSFGAMFGGLRLGGAARGAPGAAHAAGVPHWTGDREQIPPRPSAASPLRSLTGPTPSLHVLIRCSAIGLRQLGDWPSPSVRTRCGAKLSSMRGAAMRSERALSAAERTQAAAPLSSNPYMLHDIEVGQAAIDESRQQQRHDSLVTANKTTSDSINWAEMDYCPEPEPTAAQQLRGSSAGLFHALAKRRAGMPMMCISSTPLIYLDM